LTHKGLESALQIGSDLAAAEGMGDRNCMTKSAGHTLADRIGAEKTAQDEEVIA
jgi:hypothetical protein